MGFDPSVVQDIPQAIKSPEDVLTWTQIAYYTAGTLVGLAVAYIKIKGILRRRKDARDGKNK
jgi:hypothetical protein